MDRLKVLLIAPCADPTDVGEAWSTFQWISGVAERHDVTVLSYFQRRRGRLADHARNFTVVEWPDLPLVGRLERLNSMAKPGYLSFYFKARRWIRRRLREGQRWDIAHQVAPLALRYPSPAAGLIEPLVIGPLAGTLGDLPGFRDEMRMPWYTRLRSVDRLRLRHDPLLRRSFGSAWGVIGVAPYVADLLEGCKVRKFFVQPETGVNAPEESAARARGNGVRLLYVGRMVRTKGARDAIRAMVHLDGRFRLDVVGDGEDRAACEAEVVRLKIADRVAFHGKVPRSRVEEFYRVADVFVFPSFREPSGNVVFEALAHGLPVVTSTIGGPGALVDETCGRLVTPTNPEQYAKDLAAAIREVAASPASLSALSAGARERIASQHTWPRKIEWLEALYRDAVA